MLTGTVFTLFLSLHLLNLLAAIVSAEAYNQVQSVLRGMYQNPLGETLLVFVPLTIHIYCSLRLRWLRRRKRPSPVAVRQRLQRLAGWFLLLAIAGHVLATRGASLFYGIHPGFEGLSFTLWYLPGYFYPYYFLLALAGFYHGLAGVAQAIPHLTGTCRWLRPVRLQGVLTSAAAAGFLWGLLGLGGTFYDTPFPPDSEYARLAASLFGLDIGEPF